MQHHRGPAAPASSLPSPSPGFTSKKVKIIDQLAVPDAEYTDASPKGTIDKGIRHLIDELNGADGFVTTSSCAGRVSVFLEGRKAPTAANTDEGDSSQQVAGVGGKGAGGTWLFVSHDVVKGEDWIQSLEFTETCHDDPGKDKRLIHFKFEPMILHVLTTSLLHAQLLIRCALQAGFRESGAINITPQADSTTTPIVAIRSMGLSFESLIGYESPDGARHPLVPETYLQTLMDIGTERFSENAKRIARFTDAFREVVLRSKGTAKINPEGREWEDAASRRERMKAEGLLRRKEAMRVEEKIERSEVDLEGYDIP
ncbi:hypothetical protein QQS21_010162 [Conoideocrella luteorostrata]|uniref:tRNA(Phe) 7-[(3-amino-3-carboxypropyl)-4-demethylwyosine(37)-N(4)]-methyltransferase n=1 Tax=Conoideocrella luteorostrata TaxID=1105319 RepID=A0AAJ0FUG6_9HYPO|nr:hypothetical protein QQS21_010162 [Conoideocrella luteorostrata]